MKFKFLITLLISIVILVGILYVFPSNLIISDVSNILTATTVLFGILAGFLLASALSNYLRLQTLISEETATLISIYQVCLATKPGIKKQIISAIDNYVIAAFDYELVEYIDKSWPQFNQVIKTTEKISFENCNWLYELKANAVRIRQEISLTARKLLSPEHWVFLISLAAIIIFLLYVMHEPTIISSFVTILLSTATIMVLFLLREIDSNFFAEDKLAYDIFQRVFLEMNLLPYYPEDVLSGHKIKLAPGKYRIGYYKNAETLDKNIKIFQLK